MAAGKFQFENAAIAILVAILFDSLDGRVARLTQTQSEFGAQMDSLADMVCFGVSPALVLYSWSLSTLGKPGWLAAFIYTVCTLLRLARFNSQSQQTNKRYFQGLPTPAAAGTVASIIWVSEQYLVNGHDKVIAMMVLTITVLLGLLKVSTIRYRSFKDLDIRDKVPFIVIILIVLLFVLVSFDPPDLFLLICSAYVVSGPISTLWRLRVARRLHGRSIELNQDYQDRQDYQEHQDRQGQQEHQAHLSHQGQQEPRDQQNQQHHQSQQDPQHHEGQPSHPSKPPKS